MVKLKPKANKEEALCSFMMTMPRKHYTKLKKLGKPHSINVQEVIRQMVSREMEKV